MDKKELKKLNKEVKNILNKRKPFLAKSEKQRLEYQRKEKILKTLSLILLFFIGLSSSYSVIYKSQISIKTLIGGFNIFFLISTMSKLSHLSSAIKPKDEKKDEWLWKMENKVTKTYILSLPFVLLIPFLTSHSSRLFNLIFGLSALFALISILMNFFISKKPLLFFNQKYTETASFLVTLSGLLFIFSVPIYIIGFFKPENSIFEILSIIGIIIFISLKITFSDTENTNLSQKYALKLIKPKVILNCLKGKKNIYDEEIKGLEFLKKIENTNSLIAEKIIIERLSKKHYTKTSQLFIGILFVLAFIVGAIAESATQDLFWTDTVKSFLCEKIGLYC